MRRLASAAALAALALAAPAGAQSPLTPEQGAAVDQRIRDYLIVHPEVILEALEVLEQRRNDAQAKADADLIASSTAALFEDGYSHVFGNPEGDVTIVEFSDYRCGYCKRAHPDVQRLLAEDGKIRLVLKEFPILGPESTLAARVAMAALREDPKGYAALHDAMMAHKGALDEATIFGLATSVGLDANALRLAMADPAIEANIRRTYELAQALRVEGTPAFVIGDRVLRGFAPYDAMAQMVAEARAAD